MSRYSEESCRWLAVDSTTTVIRAEPMATGMYDGAPALFSSLKFCLSYERVPSLAIKLLGCRHSTSVYRLVSICECGLCNFWNISSCASFVSLLQQAPRKQIHSKVRKKMTIMANQSHDTGQVHNTKKPKHEKKIESSTAVQTHITGAGRVT
jgi:hypothetical protein